jgi:hypothetical protein
VSKNKETETDIVTSKAALKRRTVSCVTTNVLTSTLITTNRMLNIKMSLSLIWSIIFDAVIKIRIRIEHIYDPESQPKGAKHIWHILFKKH